MPRLCRLLPCCLLALVVGFFVPGSEEAWAQERDEEQTGPTRASLNQGAASLAVDSDVSAVWIRHRINTFQDDFSDDFGVARPLRRGEVVDHLEGRIAARWGDTEWYDWVRRGLAVYARIQALTEAERKGFDMEVKTSDLTEGKLGVRVSRALD